MTARQERRETYQPPASAEQIARARQIARENVQRLRQQRLAAYKRGLLTVPVEESLIPE